MKTINYEIMELTGDTETPISIYLKTKQNNPIFLLESAERGEQTGRYSFIGYYPWLSVNGYKNHTLITKNKKTEELINSSPITTLKNLLSEYNTQNLGLPFYGGLTGYFSYDFIRYLEVLPDTNIDDLNLPFFNLSAPAVYIIFDHLFHKLFLVGVINPDSNFRDIKILMDKVKTNIEKPLKQEILAKNTSTTNDTKSNLTKHEFIKMVNKAKEYITKGDIFQVVLSQRFNINVNYSSFQLYRKLRKVNPSPYMFLLNYNGYSLIGSSPEVHVKKTGKTTLIRPIAGTRIRGKDLVEDKRLAKELLEDKKELAEHTMLVDLGRNDIGKVCIPGSIKLKDSFRIEHYSHVMHIVSDVEGELKKDISSVELLASTFPAGTVSGAPKIRAMEIIDELENIKRGPYSGAVGYLDFNGDMDTAITIRTIVKKGDNCYIQAGAGIVYDSNPENEYFETINKAKAQIKTITED